MPRVLSFCRSKSIAILIWIFTAILFYLTLRISMENSNSSPALIASSDSGSRMSIAERRKNLYDKMARDLDEHGAVFLKGGETSQSLSISELFELKNGSVTPVLKKADPPVRATVLYLSSEYSIPISKTVREVFLPYFDSVIWFQNMSIYHSSMFHASHHLIPVIATNDQLRQIVLKVVSGTDPAVIREKLRAALPRAPGKQLYDSLLLHTSFARILGRPKILFENPEKPSDSLQLFHELVDQLNKKLQGFEATISELWFVEEHDVLALALDGRMKIRKFPLGCKQN